jgi:hypothetical protein
VYEIGFEMWIEVEAVMLSAVLWLGMYFLLPVAWQSRWFHSWLHLERRHIWTDYMYDRVHGETGQLHESAGRVLYAQPCASRLADAATVFFADFTTTYLRNLHHQHATVFTFVDALSGQRMEENQSRANEYRRDWRRRLPSLGAH